MMRWRIIGTTILTAALFGLLPLSCSAQWTAAALLNDPSETSVKSGRIHAARSGGFHAVYSRMDVGQMVYRRYANGYLAPRVVLRSGFVPNPAVCEAGNGDVHVAWEDWDDGLEVGWSKSSDGGRTFAAFQEITNTGDTKHPHLAAFGGDDSPDVIMSNWQASNKNLYWRRYGGASWGPLYNMEQNADNEYEVFGMCRSLQDGTVYRSYGTKIGGVLSVCYRRYNGLYWEPQVVVASPDFFARHDIAVNPVGQIMVMWERDEQVRVRVFTPGVGWGAIQSLGAKTGFAAVTAIPGSSDFCLVYTYDCKRMYAVRYSGGGFLPAELVSVGLPDAFTVGADVSAGPDGTIYAVWEYWATGGPQQWFSIRPGGPPPDAALEGFVRDQFGHGVSGATVGAGAYATVSGAGGAYLLKLPAGTYSVSANKDYYTGQTVAGVVVYSGQTTTLDLTITANPPAPPSGFRAVPSQSLNRLFWTNPASGNFQGTMVRYKTTGYPTDPEDGYLVCDRPTSPGQSDSFVHTGLTNGLTYYYAAFAHDDAAHCSGPVYAEGTPLDLTCAGVKQFADNSPIDLCGKIVSAVFVSTDGCVYIREPDGSSGIRVVTSESGLAVGDVVSVSGNVETRRLSGYASERQIGSAVVTKLGLVSECGPVAMACRSVGGSQQGLCPGVRGGVGLNNMGLLVRIVGRVTCKSGQYMFIDDGSGIANLLGASTAVVGVMVKCPSSSIPAVVGDVVSVTGIVEGSVPNNPAWSTNRPYIHMRGWDDLTIADQVSAAGST